MEATPRTTDVTTTGGIWMMEASPDVSSAAPSRTTSSSGLEQTTSSPSIPPILEPSSAGPSAGLVAGCVVGVLALILLAAGAAFIILKKRGIIFNNDDAAPSTERADPEGSTFSNLLGEKSAGTRSREGPPPLPASGPPVTPGRRRRPARKQEDPLPVPDNDTYANLLEEPREAPIHKRNQRDPLPTPDDNTYMDLLQETPTINRSQERPLPTNEYIDLPQETPSNNRSQGDPLPPLDDNTYMDLLEETRETPDNNIYTNLLDRPDNHTSQLNQRNQPDGAERMYQNVNVPGRAQRVPYVNVTELRPSPRAQQSETADGMYEMADPGGGSTYENCSPAEYVNNCSPAQYENCSPAQYVNAGAGGNITETSFMNRENADNLYEDVQPENEPTYANQ